MSKLDIKFKRLTPFKRCILQNFPFIEEDFDALTNYGLLCKVVAYLNKVIESQNEVEGVTEEIVTAFNNLYDYVKNYFDNLDVQDEINNKLDEMVEDGELQEIIDEYLNVLKETYIINDITFEKGEIDGTEYYIAYVPHLDSEDNVIALKHGFAQNNNTATATCDDTAREFALRNYATFAVNASIFGIDENESNYHHAMGTIIKDGSLVSTYDTAGYTDATQARMRLVGVKSDGSLETYAINASYDSLIADGVVNTFAGYGTYLENGVITGDYLDTVGIWNFICQKSDTKDLMFICCNGRDIQDQAGLTPRQMMNIVISKGYDYAFQIDGGGSTCFVEQGIMVNEPFDNQGRTVRKTPDYIYFGKTPQTNVDYNIARVTADASNADISSKILKNKVSYLQHIDNNYLDLGFPNIRHTAAGQDGVHIRYSENGELKKQFIFGDSTYPKSISLFDNENNTTLIRANADDGSLLLGNHYFATFFRTAENNSTPDSLLESGIWRIPGNVSGLPFTGVGCILIALKGSSGGTQQIIIPQKNDSTTNGWYTRHYNESNQTWESWKLLLTPSNPA